MAATLAATGAASSPRIEIVEERRRSHDAAFRARVLADAQRPGARVAELGRRYGICTSLIYRWRREASAPPLAAPTVRLVPVRVAGAEAGGAEPRAMAPRPPLDGRRPGSIEIELRDGTRIRVDADVGLAALRRVVAALRG